LNVTISPVISSPRAITTLSESLSTSSWPRSRRSGSMSGLSETRILRPAVKMSTVPSSLALRNVP
jgi:hypothetical protein